MVKVKLTCKHCKTEFYFEKPATGIYTGQHLVQCNNPDCGVLLKVATKPAKRLVLTI